MKWLKGATLLVLLALAGFWAVPLPEALESPGSVMLLDRHGTPLRENWRAATGSARPVHLDQLPVSMIQATLAAEDARFFRHAGVDWRGVARAAWTNWQAGRVVSGGSTLTQQLIASACGRCRGSADKALEMLRALRLEWRLSKQQILELYLNRVSYGNNATGVESAARFYFGRPAARLSVAQCAFLAGLPCGPDYFDPLRHPERARERQVWILQRMRRLNWLGEDPLQQALAEPLRVESHPAEFRAPHFCELALEGLPERVVEARTTLDLETQITVERLVRATVEPMRQRGLNSAAVVVLENSSGAVRALVGSPNYFDAEADGQVNAAVAQRQPGSALKPFTYGLALERGLTPATILFDLPVRYREFAPQNYDRQFHGPVRLRSALASSYNVPAVKLTHEMGPAALLDRLREAGLSTLTRPAEHYGLALTLGAGEVRLLELTNAYRSLARQGEWTPPHLWEEWRDGSGNELSLPPSPGRGRVFSREVAFLLTDILSDPAARAPGFGHESVLALPFACAVKTGTSRDYRDNWAVGYTTRYTVGVWAGNTRGTPMREVSGVSGAGPLFRDIMLALHSQHGPEPFVAPPGLCRTRVCALSGELAGPYCPGSYAEWFPAEHVPVRRCGWHDRRGTVYPAECEQWASERGLVVRRTGGILAPRDGDRYVLDPGLARRFQTLELRSSRPVRWSVDGRALSGSSWPLQRGTHRVEARQEDGSVETAAFTVY